MRMKELEALVLSLQDQLIKQHEWATSEIAKRDAIIEAQAAKIVALEDKIRELTAQLKANSKNSSKRPPQMGSGSLRLNLFELPPARKQVDKRVMTGTALN